MTNSINRFFSDADEREPDLRALDELVRATVPKLAADRHLMDSMSFEMIGYGMYHYYYASGKEGDWPVIGLANQKNYISLYVCAHENGAYLAESYGKRLGKVNTGKSCIRFKSIDDLDLDAVKELLHDARKWWSKQPKPSV